MKLGIWAFEVSRHLKRMRVATINASVGKISGAVGAYNNIDPRVEDLVCEELGIGREPISNQVVQRDRHAEFLTTHRPGRREHREVRHRDAAPAAHRGARGRGGVRQGPEGVLGHAAQAQPHPQRAHGRAARACCAATRWSAWRTWRCGTSATSATARPSASCCPTARSCSTTCCRSSPGSWTTSSWTRSACWRTWARATASSSAGRSCWPWSTRACCARTPTAWCRTRPCRPGATASTSATSSRPRTRRWPS